MTNTTYKTKKPHVHAEVIKSWADGADIEWTAESLTSWYHEKEPTWNCDLYYRVKPEPKPDFVFTGMVSNLDENYEDEKDNLVEFVAFRSGYSEAGVYSHDNLKLTFDGETGKLKSAEVIG